MHLTTNVASSLSKTLELCLETETFADVVICCRETVSQWTTIRVNASVLAASSQFFRGILSSPAGIEQTVILPDYSSVEVRALLQLCYTGKIDKDVPVDDKVLNDEFQINFSAEKSTAPIRASNSDSDTERRHDTDWNPESTTKSQRSRQPNKTSEDKVCEVCGKYFARPALLSNHRRIHTGERPFECNVCKRTFKEKSHLTRHQRGHNGNASRYQCAVCEKSFANRFYLLQHEFSHSGYKRLLCSVCGYRCFQSSDLKKHMRTHTGEKPYKCKFCDKTFSQKVSCARHMQTVHKVNSTNDSSTNTMMDS